MSPERGHRRQGKFGPAVLCGLILIGALLLPRPAPAQAPGASETEVMFWKSVAEGDTPAEYRAYLQLYPSGQFAELAKARAGGAGSASSGDAIALAVAQHRLFALGAPIVVHDADTGEACSLVSGDVVAVKSVPAEADTTVRLQVVTGKRGDCPATGVVDAARTDLADMLAAFARSAQQRKLRPDATPPERVFWQSIAGERRASDYQAYLKTYPDGPFAGLASARLAEIGGAAAQEQAEQQRAAEEKARTGTQDTEAALALPQSQWVLIQRSLGALGYAPGPADGAPGDRTRQAIRQFQHAQAVPETGYFNQQQLSDLLGQAREPLAREDRERAAAQQRAEAAAAEQARAEAAAQAAYPAIALAWNNEGAYASRTGRTLEEARQAALDACNQITGGGCYLSKLAIQPGARYCYAIVRDQTNRRTSVGWNASASGASVSAMEWCSSHGQTGCHIMFSGCNGK